MSLLSRATNVFRGERLNREIEEELSSHVAEAVAEGRDPEEARRTFGSMARQQQESHDTRVFAWLDSLRADLIFGWRQLKRNKVTSAAAILSLALAIGSCTSAFRLIDALLLRPLPVAHPERLYSLSRKGMGFDNRPGSWDSWAYPEFELVRDAAKNQADLIAISYTDHEDVTYKTDNKMEKANVQYVSGSMFPVLGIRAVIGSLFTAENDLKQGNEPYAVISYDYWNRRFGRDPKIIGRIVHFGEDTYQIIGVSEKKFTGTEPGIVVDMFVPAMMSPRVKRDDSTWVRMLVAVKPGVAAEPLRARFAAIHHAFEAKRLSGETGLSAETLKNVLNNQLTLDSASTGVSEMQSDYSQALAALGALVLMVLLIACANVANLMTAQSTARAREMALRVSIGAGRWRLVRMVLTESALLGTLAAIGGALFAWWSAPFVISMINPPDNPVRLILPADWRVLGFGIALTLAVVMLFGLLPALRASSIHPGNILKGGDDPHSRHRAMRGMIAVQVAFCFLVLFIAGLFVATFERLSNKSPGFSSERLLVLSTVSQPPQTPIVWDQVAEHLRTVPGIEKVSQSRMALLGGNSWNDSISVNGGPPSTDLAYFLGISPGWLDTMKIPLIAGRDFRQGDVAPGAAIVNETFAREFLHDDHPVGRPFDKAGDDGGREHMQVIGVVPDSAYRNLREPILPVVYIPLYAPNGKGGWEPMKYLSFVVRTGAVNPMALASTLRREAAHGHPEFRVTNINTQKELIEAQTIRERLLATLAFFFGAVALLLAGIGLYGVLNYSVLQQQKEIGIRMALGARAGHVARKITAGITVAVVIGTAAGLALGLASTRYIESLLYGVKATDPAMLAAPCLTILVAMLLAAIPAIVRAIHIDPVITLRSE